MLNLPDSVRVFVATHPVDMRRSFDGLCFLVQQYLGQDPLSGDLFVFRNRRGDCLKLLWWDRDGLAIWYKRLEQGNFLFPKDPSAVLTLTGIDLQLILQGIDLSKVQRQHRYQRPAD
ncbi:MAG: IS66 family insertion sequence element accessory protein TnpB [Zavarzinella sp.]